MLKEELRQRVERPKDFRFLRILFTSGSLRTIVPTRTPQLTVDFDKEEKVVRLWSTRPDGKIICEEY